VATFERSPREAACVSCSACFFEIPLVNALRLPGEFSVPCPNCGQRKVYRSAEAHDPKSGTEATKTFGRVHFPARERTTMQPKSWLNGWVAWLHS
jgi:hypothetical protein